MNWKNYSTLIREEQFSSHLSHKGRMADLLSGHGVVDLMDNKNHSWYPKGRRHNEQVNGHRYVDMNYSYFGKDSVLVSEASCCMLMVLVDLDSQLKFCAHISAASDTKRRAWLLVNADLSFFFKSVDKDMSRVALYLFSENMHWNNEGSFEQRNVMSLLSAALSEKQVMLLAKSTYLVQGEGGEQWNPFCSVRLKNNVEKPMLNITFVNVSL